jgi:uncharacterized protein (DUF58 family)
MPETLAPNYLDPQTLAAIGPLELRARMVVEGLMTGMHRSPHQGVSVEFAQHRPYTSGDDLRYLDWKVFGRTDKLYLKQYQKETNLDLVMIVDASGSMAYGSGRGQGAWGPRGQGSDASASTPRPLGPSAPSWRKYDHAACLAAAMSYLALRQQDRVGLMTFAGQLAQATRLSNVYDHWRTIVELLSKAPLDEREASTRDATEPVAAGPSDTVGGPGTDLARVFDQLLAKLTRRSLLVLISDLFDSIESLERACARVAHRRHDLIVMQTLDHAERTFPFRGPSDFLGLEGEGRIGLDPAALRQAYLEALERHLRRAEEITRRFRFDYLLLDTSEPLNAPLSHFLAKRAAMISKGK